MPRIKNGVLESRKKGTYEELDEEHGGNGRTLSQKCNCSCDCKSCLDQIKSAKCINCDSCDNRCNCACSKNCKFYPSMLLTMDAVVAYVVLISCGLLSYFVSWKLGVIIFVICGIAFAFWINYRCCGANGARLQNTYTQNASRRGKNGRSKIMEIGDLPKPARGG